MIKKIFLGIFFVISLSNIVMADEYCINEKNTYETNLCLKYVKSKMDKAINQVYQEVIKKDPKHKSKLVQSELAWIKWRDLECNYQSLTYEGGTLQSPEYTRWYIRLTKERIQHLQDTLKKLSN